jgi:hypothetical protein
MRSSPSGRSRWPIRAFDPRRARSIFDCSSGSRSRGELNSYPGQRWYVGLAGPGGGNGLQALRLGRM